MYLLKRTFISAIFLLLGLSTMKGTVLNSIYFEDPPKEKKDSTQSKEDSTRVNKLENKLIELSFELDNLKQKIKDGHDTTNNIGTIKMSKSVIVYKSSKEGIDMPSDTIKISHIKLYVHEGVIKELRMTTADGRLFWNKIHISLTYFERKRWYKIYQKPEKGKLKKTFESHHVLLGDIISYIPSLGTNFSC